MLLTQLANEWGGIAPRVLEVLANKHHIPLRKTDGGVWVSAWTRRKLARLPEVQRMRQMAALDDLGGDLTEVELHVLSTTQPGQLPWTRKPKQ